MRIILATIAFVFLATPSWGEPVEATPKDLYEFGWEYVGETVSIYGIPTELYACRQPSNKGSVCFHTKSYDRTYDIAIFRKGIKSREIKPLENQCSLMTGTVEERDTQTEGAQTRVPRLIVDEIELADPSRCIVVETIIPRPLSDL